MVKKNLRRMRDRMDSSSCLSVVPNSSEKKTVKSFKKVLLVNPHIIKHGKRHHFLTDWTGSEYPSSLLPPSMEFLYIHAVLDRVGVKADFLDASARGKKPNEVVEHVCRKRPELLVMAATYNSLEEVLYMTREIRDRMPGTTIALFGPPITIRPELAFRDGSVDYVILGEPEKPAADLIEGRIEENLAFFEKGTVHCLPRRLLEPLDWLPHPSRHLLRPMDYVAPFSRDYPFTVITTSRGCVHAKCKFCTQHVWAGHRIRYHSVDYVMEEIRDVVRNHGYREIFFRDQIFTGDRERTMEICQRMIQERLSVPWRATTRVNCVDKELLSMMKKAGCYQMTYGFESSSQDVLDGNCKGITLDQSVRAASITRALGIELVGNFVIGLEGDTKQNIKKVADYAIGLGCDFAQFIPAQVWHDYASAEVLATLSWKEIERLSSRAYRRFYCRPSFLMKILRRSRSPRMLHAVLRSAYRILTQTQIY